ncbi:MAG TPA: AAA family ATPase, partial [Galbitalea sp.]
MDRKVYGAGKPKTAGNKLVPPSPRGHTVARERLVAALDAAFQEPNHSFAMLTAPAGYGKTYLLMQWAAITTDRGILTAWCGLDTDDRDPVVLWTTLLDSLVHATDEGEVQLRTRLGDQSPSMDARLHSLFIGELFSALSEYTKPIVLLFDDVHLLEGSPAEGEFVRLIQGLPENVKIAFATRSPLQTHAARISGRLTELTADSLSFTRAETMELFTFCGADATDFEDFYVAVEGWPAALSLATLSVTKLDDRLTKVLDWDDESMLYPYLEHEILDDLSDDDRKILLTFGIARMATADLVDAVCEVTQSGRTLRRLSLGDGILHRVSTDVGGRTWYRVQPLFGAFLLEQLRESDATRIPEMNARAAVWHLDHGNALTAVEFALDPPNPELVDRILRQRGYEIVNDGHSPELLDIAPPSTSLAMAAPFARLMTAYAAVSAGRPDRASEFLSTPHLVELSANDLLEWDWLRYLVEMETATATGTDLAGLSPGWAESTFADLPDQLRSAIRRVRGWEEVRVGQTTTATSDLQLALAIAENEDDLASMIMSVVGLASAAATEFDVRAAKALSEHALELVSRATNQ